MAGERQKKKKKKNQDNRICWPTGLAKARTENQVLEALHEEGEDVSTEGNAALPPRTAQHRHGLTTATTPMSLKKRLKGRSSSNYHPKSLRAKCI